MCDLVNSNFHRYGKDTVKALRLKLQKKTKPQTQYLALVALEMCMKNCGVMFHAKVIEKACLDETTKCGAQRGRRARQAEGSRPRPGVGAAAPTAAVQSRVRRTAPKGRALPAHGAHVRRGDPDVHPAPEPHGHRRAEARADGPRRRRRRPSRRRRGGGGGGSGGAPNGDAIAEGVKRVCDVAGRRVDARGVPAGNPGVSGGIAARIERAPRRAPRGYEALDEDESFHGTAERNGTAERTYSDGNPYGTAGGGHTSNPTPRSHHAHYPVSHRPELQPPAADASALGDVTSPDAVKKLHDDLDVASNTVKVLRDMLGEVDVVTSPEALNDPTIDELSEQCAQMRPRVVSLVQSVADESLLMKALSLNDDAVGGCAEAGRAEGGGVRGRGHARGDRGVHARGGGGGAATRVSRRRLRRGSGWRPRGSPRRSLRRPGHRRPPGEGQGGAGTCGGGGRSLRTGGG